MGGITLQELKEYRQKNGIDAKTSTIKNQGIVSKEQSDRIHSVQVPDRRTPGKFVERYRNPALFLGAKFTEATEQAEGEPDRGPFNVSAYEKLGDWLTSVGDAWFKKTESYKKEQEVTPEVVDGVPQTLLGNIGFASYGKRKDGTQKGSGFLGELKDEEGNNITELSIGVNIDGEEMEIPSIVPTLTKDEVDYLVSGGEMTDAIVEKATKHAQQRLAKGKSPFFSREEEPVSEFTMHLSRTFGLETDVERRGLDKLLNHDDHKIGREVYEMIVEELPLKRSAMQREKAGTMFGEAEFDKADIHQIIMSNVLSVGVGGFMAGENGTTVAAEGHSLLVDMVQKVSGVDRKAALQLVDKWSVRTMAKLANNAREIGEFTEQEINPYAWTQDPRQISTADPRISDPRQVYQSGVTYWAARAVGVGESLILSMADTPFAAADFKDRMLKNVRNPVVRTTVDYLTHTIPTGKRLGFETAEELENFRVLFDPTKSPLANINPGAQETRMHRQLEARREGLGAMTKQMAIESAFDYAALVAGIMLTKKLVAKTGLASLVRGKAPLSAAKTARLARTVKGGLTHTVLNKAELARSLSATFRNAAFVGSYRAITTPGSFEDRLKSGLITGIYMSTPGTTGLLLHKLGITNPGVVLPVLTDMAQNMVLTTGLSHIPEYKRQGGFTDEFIANAVVQTMMDGLMSVTTRGIRDADRIMDIARTRYGKYYDGVAKNGKVVDLISGKQVSKQEYVDGKIQQRHNQPVAVTEAYIQMLKEKTTEQVDIPGLEVPKVEIRPYQDPDVRRYLKAEQKLLSKRGEIEEKRLEVEMKIGELEGRTDRTPQEQRSLTALKGRKTRLDNQLARMEGEGEPELTKDPEAISEPEAVKNAAKYKSAEDMWDAQPKVYHGTLQKFEDFDPSFLGKATGAKSAEEGFFFATNKKVAEGYADEAGDIITKGKIQEAQNKIKELTGKSSVQVTSEYARGKDFPKEVVNQIDKIQEYNDSIQRASDDVFGDTKVSGDVKEVALDMKNPFVYDANEQTMRQIGITDIIKDAKTKGHDSVIIKNTYDPAVEVGDKLTDVHVVFDKSQIKTKSQLTNIWKKAHAKKSKYEGYVTQIQSINRQIAQFNKGLKAGKNIAAKDIKAFQDHISKVIDETGILTKDQKNTLRKQTRNLHPIKRTKKGREEARKSLSQLRNKIQELSDENEMQVFKDATKRVLNKAKKDIKKGKFDPDTAKALSRAIYINKVPGEARDDIGTSSADMLEYDIGQLHRVTLTKGQARGIYNDLIRVYNRGAATRAGWKAAKEAEANQIIRLAIADLTGKAAEDVKLLTPEQFQQKGNLFGWWFNFLRGSRHWQGLMTDLAQRTQTRPGESNIERFTDMNRPARYNDELTKKYNNKKVGVFKIVFGLKNRFQIKDKYDQDLKDEKRIPLSGKESAVINRAIARQRWAEWQQDAGRVRLQGRHKYTPDTIKAIEQFLKPEDFDLIRETKKIYDEFYQEVNDVFRMDKGYDLPYRKGYTPFIAEFAQKAYEGVDLIDQMHFDVRKEPVIDNKSPLKELKGKTAGIKAQGDISLLDRYIQDMSHYVSHAKTIERAKTIFGSEQVRQIISQKYGKHMVNVIDTQLDTLTRGKLEAAQRNVYGGLNFFRSLFVKGALYFRPKRAVVQLLSTGLYLTEMPGSALAKGILDLPRAIKSGEINAIKDVAWYSERGIGLERDLAKAVKIMDSPDFSKFKQIVNNPRIDHIGGMFMRLGDRAAILAGGWSLYKHLTQTKKMDKVEALDRVINFSNKTQQSKDLAQMGTILQSGNPIVRLLTLFKHTTGQFYNNYLDAFVNSARISKLELAKTILAYHGMATTYAVINNGLKIATTGALASMISGPMGDGIAIGGDFIKGVVGWAIAKVKNEDYRPTTYGSNILESWYKDVIDTGEIISDLVAKGEYASADDVMGLIEAVSKASYPVSGGVGAAVHQATRVYGGVKSYSDSEDFNKMLQKFMGYTDWQIKQMRGQ